MLICAARDDTVPDFDDIVKEAMELRPTANLVGPMGKRLGANTVTIFKGYKKMSKSMKFGK